IPIRTRTVHAADHCKRYSNKFYLISGFASPLRASFRGSTSAPEKRRCPPQSPYLTQRDILDEVFSHLTPAWDEEDTGLSTWDPSERYLLRSTLAASALVCHALSEKALDCLWRVLDSIMPLLRILPGTGSCSSLRIYPDITDAAWSRFHGYARRVRELRSVECYVHIHTTWQILVQRLGGAPLLPTLWRLKTPVTASYPWQGILLLSPTLRQLEVSLPRYMPLPAPVPLHQTQEFQNETDVLVENLVQYISLPSLTDDVRHKIDQAVPEASIYLQSLGRFASLQELDLVSTGVRIGQETLQALSSLESLRALRAIVSLEKMVPSTSFHDGFPVLVALTLRGTAEDILKLLRMLPPDTLTELELNTDRTRMTVPEYKHFLADVRSLVSPNLTHLSLTPETFLRPLSALSLSDILQPMLSLRELRYLFCQFWRYPKDVSDDDLRAFATAWPKLTSFVVSYKDDIPNHVQPITVPGLVDLLQRCPRLEIFCLPTLDVAHIPSPGSVPRLDNRVRVLVVEDFVGEAEADLLALALVIDRLLPCLEFPRSKTARQRERQWTATFWDKLCLLVATLQAARRIGD
ncbi:hypothetical protein C8T65DRAFT_777768, partial [Cerioporus squamosus]